METETRAKLFASSKTLSVGWDLFLIGILGWIVFRFPLDLLFHLHDSVLFIAADLVISALLIADYYMLGDLNDQFSAGKSRSPAVVFAVFPLYSVLLLFGAGASWIALLQANHLLRLPHLVMRIIWRNENKLLGKGVKLFFILISTFLIMHCLACLWMLIQPTGKDMITEYNRALYWTITTITTVGYGDITPQTNLARSFTMLVMLLGVLFYGVVIGQVSRYLLSADRRRELEKEKLENLAAFFRHYEISGDLQAETYRYYRYALDKNVIESERKILQELPDGLRAKLMEQINIRPLSRLSLFRDCPRECMFAASQALEPAYFNQGDRIFSRGDDGAEMYLIRFGRVKIHNGEQVIAEVGEGQCFGEMSLVNSEPRSADVTAETTCDLFVLRKADFDRLLGQYAVLRNNVSAVAGARKEKAS